VLVKGPCRVRRSVRGCALSFLCAGCGNGEGHVAPVYAKWSVALSFAVKLDGCSRFPFKIASGPLGASGCPLGVPWVSPWCLLGAPGCLLSAPGCLLDFYFTILYSTLLYSTLFYSIRLYSTLLYSTVLYSILSYSVLLYSTLLYSTLLYSTLPYPTLLYSTLFYSSLLYPTPLYPVLLYSTLLYSILFYSTLLYSTLLYSTLLYYTLPYSLYNAILKTLFGVPRWDHSMCQCAPEAIFQSPAQDVVKEMFQTSASAVEVQQRDE
jgi:hypothetical protein